jgi:hypothetical protein
MGSMVFSPGALPRAMHIMPFQGEKKNIHHSYR